MSSRPIGLAGCVVPNLCHCGLEYLLCLGFAGILLARSEGQRLGKMNGDSAQEAVDVIDANDMARTGEVCHVKGIVRPVVRDTEPGRDVLAEVGTALVGIAGERSRLAANIHHLPL